MVTCTSLFRQFSSVIDNAPWPTCLPISFRNPQTQHIFSPSHTKTVSTQATQRTILLLYGWITLHMTTGLMPRFTSHIRIRRPKLISKHFTPAASPALTPLSRTLANVRDRDASVSTTWFTSTAPSCSPDIGDQDHRPPDERTLKLGKSMLCSLWIISTR